MYIRTYNYTVIIGTHTYMYICNYAATYMYVHVYTIILDTHDMIVHNYVYKYVYKYMHMIHTNYRSIKQYNLMAQ